MAFVVEDGTGTNPLANAYVSVAEADTYFLDRNVTEWAAYTDAQKEGGIIYATSYLDNTVQWYGLILSTTQPLDWPRSTFYDSEWREFTSGTIPQPLKDAVCELAYQHIQSGLNDTTSEAVASEKIGDASITYSGGSSSKSFSFIKVMMRELGTTGTSSNSTAYRS